MVTSLEKLQEFLKTMPASEARSRDLVPQSGNWEKPYRWVKPDEYKEVPKRSHRKFLRDHSIKSETKQESIFGRNDFHSALDWYTEDGYKRINPFLRGRAKGSERVKETINILDAAFEAVTPLKKEIVVYRGVGKNFPKDKIIPGKRFKDPAFISTSLRKRVAEYDFSSLEGFLFQIKVKRGQKILGVTRGNAYSGEEAEVILPRNTVFRVAGIHEENIGFHYRQKIVELEVE